jgi:hypothetical protein
MSPVNCTHCRALRTALDEANLNLGRATTALLQEQQAAEAAIREVQRLRDGIQSAAVALEEPDNTTDTVWFNVHTTLLEHLQYLLDPGPKARGERPLVLGEGA